MPYFALASGFLTGKYRAGITVDSPRAAWVTKYLDERGQRLLEVLDETPRRIRRRWRRSRSPGCSRDATIAAPIASARTGEQLADLLPAVDLRLDADEIARLTKAGQHR